MVNPILTRGFFDIVLKIVLIVGIILRIFYQFYEPAFDLDEIHLGLNIKEFSYIELIYPLENLQSAPPFYLWTQKLLIKVLPFPFWINIKFLSTLCAIVNIILFYRLLKKFDGYIFVVFMLAIFAVNPYIIYNSLTLKQYTVDLLGILILANYLEGEKFNRYAWIFFMVWILFSNAGLFGCVGFIIFKAIRWVGANKTKSINTFFQKHFKLFLAPIPYVIFFIWYINQIGAIAQQNYMLHVWRNTFLTLDLDGLFRLLTIGHVIYTHFFNVYEIWGIFLSAIFIFGLFALFRNMVIEKSRLYLLGACIFFVHLVMNFLHLYPIVERSILYISPFFILFLGFSLKCLIDSYSLTKYRKVIVLPIAIFTVVLYLTYSPQKKNNVIGLYNILNSCNDENKFYITPRAKQGIVKFNDFTDNRFKENHTLLNAEDSLQHSKYLISWVHKKLKSQSLSNNEKYIETLLEENRIILLAQTGSYNVFRILN